MPKPECLKNDENSKDEDEVAMPFIRTSPFALRHFSGSCSINPDPNLGFVVIHGENFAGVLLLHCH